MNLNFSTFSFQTFYFLCTVMITPLTMFIHDYLPLLQKCMCIGGNHIIVII